jgi:hypothetical protein
LGPFALLFLLLFGKFRIHVLVPRLFVFVVRVGNMLASDGRAHDANRVQFSMGRDLVLNPPQAGDPLNYFVYPYVEVDGKKWENISNQFSFADAGTSSIVATRQ